MRAITVLLLALGTSVSAQASAYARPESGELRRDLAGAAFGREGGPQAQQAPPPAAPAPGSPATFKTGADLAAILSAVKPNAAGMFSSNVTTNDQYRVSVIKRDKAAGALAHAGNSELLYILEGEGTMVTGGKLVAAADGKPASVADGVSQHFVKGDVFIVPPGSPHWFAVIDKPVTYLEVRWVAPLR